MAFICLEVISMDYLHTLQTHQFIKCTANKLNIFPVRSDMGTNASNLQRQNTTHTIYTLIKLMEKLLLSLPNMLNLVDSLQQIRKHLS